VKVKYPALMVGGAIPMAVAAMVVASSGSAHAQQPRPGMTRAQPRLSTPNYRTSPRLLNHFQVLRRETQFKKGKAARIASASASDALLFNPTVTALYQLDLSATELIQTSSGPVWIVPGGAGACILTGQATATPQPVPGENFVGCNSTATMLAHGLVIEGGKSGAQVVVGLVPDGTTSVTLTPQQGNAQTVSVANGIFRAPAPQQAFSVEPTGPSGAQSQATTNFMAVANP
jgi:hypothetical protein